DQIGETRAAVCAIEQTFAIRRAINEYNLMTARRDELRVSIQSRRLSISRSSSRRAVIRLYSLIARRMAKVCSMAQTAARVSPI
ncbi:MAG: hypothetical protein AAFQ99_13315, partial [Pseudomonadota bacterium]